MNTDINLIKTIRPYMYKGNEIESDFCGFI